MIHPKRCLAIAALVGASFATDGLAESHVAVPGDAAADYARLVEEHFEARAEYLVQLQEILDSEGGEDAAEFARDWDPTRQFVELFAAKGGEHARTEGAAPFWVWILMNDGAPEDQTVSEHSRQALEMLLRDHREHGDFLEVVTTLGRIADGRGRGRCLSLCETILAAEPGLALERRALFSRALIRAGAPEVSDEERARAITDLKRIAELEGETLLGERAAGFAFELEHLRIGCVAQDIEGNDLNGVAFKLSDYRGKVVVLDFWGDW